MTRTGRQGKQRTTDLDRRLRRELRSERRAERARRGGRLRRRLGWSLIIGGAVLFAASYVGTLTNMAVLPFDPHHQFGQLGGGVLVAVGVLLATGSSPRQR